MKQDFPQDRRLDWIPQTNLRLLAHVLYRRVKNQDVDCDNASPQRVQTPCGAYVRAKNETANE